MSTFRYSLILLRSSRGQALHVAGGALGAALLIAEEPEPDRVFHRRVGAELGGDLQQRRHPGAVVDNARAVLDRVQVGTDHHHLAGVSGAGLGNDVALRPAALTVSVGGFKGGGAGLEPGLAQHVDHILDAGVVAGGPGGPVAVVLVGDLLQRLKMLHCPGITHLTSQLLH